MPRIAPLGAFEPDETATVFDPEGEELRRAAVPAAVGALTRRHALATLTRAWGKALKGAIRQADADGRLIVDPAEPALVAATPAQAYALAGDLAALIDDMIIEGAPGRGSRRSRLIFTIPIGASPSISSRSPSPIGPNGWPSAASSTGRSGSRS